jgi:hypothetical protein
MSQRPTDDDDDFWAEARALGIAQAKALKDQAGKGGLRFEAYLPPELAMWLLGLIERGVFTDPSEVAFVILGEHKDLEPHADLRQEALRRSIQAATDDPHPGFSIEDVRQQLEKLRTERQAPAVWQRPPRAAESDA